MATLKDNRSNNPASDAQVAGVDMKLEGVVIPVSDVERAKDFYVRLGWRLDADLVDGGTPTDRRIGDWRPHSTDFDYRSW